MKLTANIHDVNDVTGVHYKGTASNIVCPSRVSINWLTKLFGYDK